MISSKFSIKSGEPRLSVLTLAGLLWRHLQAKRRKQIGLLFGLLVISALFEIVSLGAILPFLGALTAPEKVFAYPIVQVVVQRWGIVSADQLVLLLAIVFAAAALASGGIRLILLWANARLAFATGADISAEIFRRTLHQPYHVHISRNSSSVLSGITQKAAAASNVLLALLTLATSLILFVAIMITLIAIDPTVALVAGLCFGMAYVMVAVLVRRRLLKNGQRFAREHANLIKVVQEGLGGIRDVLLDGTQAIYCDQYRRADLPMRYAQGDNVIMAGAPRLAMEALGVALIAIIAYAISRQPGGVAAALPVLGALALGAQRLLPVFQQMYGAWAAVMGNQAPVLDVLDLLGQPLPPAAVLPTAPLIEFKREIRFESVGFRYSEGGPWILQDLNLLVAKGERIGIIGGTGSGKSTALDLLLGLLSPTVGAILVDGEPILGERLRSWQRSLAHVPQSIYLSDSSIAENIAFGLQNKKIDLERVKQMAAQAQLAEFIEGQPAGYGALVGERGVRLSGGQRQRIGIARALYKHAPVLVLDEATSALDNLTEHAVIEAIERLNRDLTIFIIAHRLTTVRGCDRIVELVDGRAVVYSSYEEMMASHPGAQLLDHSSAVLGSKV